MATRLHQVSGRPAVPPSVLWGPRSIQPTVPRELHRVFPSTRVAGVNKSFYWPFRPEPFEITERLSSQHVRVRRKATPANPQPGRPQIVHTRRLKPYRPQAGAFDYSDLSIQTS